MDQKQSEKSAGILRGSEGSGIASLTPQKTNEPLPSGTKLSERFKIIAEFFNQMSCSLRLLNLCKKSPTFRNVSSQVEVLTKRKFLYKHLAQIKYILSEAIQIDRILVHDKKTLCMMPDVKITLLLDDIDEQPGKSRVMALQELFASRLEDFVGLHPEACDVPEATLPEIFYRNFHSNNPLDDVDGVATVQSQPTSEIGNSSEVPRPLEHFRKHFSKKVIVPDLEKTSLLISSSPLTSLLDQEIEIRHENCLDSPCVKFDAVKGQPDSGQDEATTQGFPGLTASVYSGQLTNIRPAVSSIACESPAVKVSPSAESMLIETPAQLTPMRATSNNRKSMSTGKCMSCHKPAKRSLNFSEESDGTPLSFAVDESKSCEHVSKSTYTPIAESSISNSGAAPERESGDLANNQCFRQSNSGMCQQMQSCLPGTVAVINDIFLALGCSSITREELIHKIIMNNYDVVERIINDIFLALGCSSITREELIHKIIMNNYDVVERREVEEQVELLEKLVPDWISRKSQPSGDTIYSVRKVSNIESILSRLIST